MNARQLNLDLAHRPALDRADFLVAESNADAIAWIDRYPDWPAKMLVVFGPSGSGKTHLGHVFAMATNAGVVRGGDIGDHNVATLSARPALVIDNADLCDEEPLLHLINSLREANGGLLLLASRAPAHWGIRLPDLRSRVAALNTVPLREPDDTLLASVMLKLFSDRQIRVREGVLEFLVARIERSFATANAIVAALDAAAMSEGRAITIPLARRVLNDFRDG